MLLGLTVRAVVDGMILPDDDRIADPAPATSPLLLATGGDGSTVMVVTMGLRPVAVLAG